MIPPPPPQSTSTIADQRKKKKRFKLLPPDQSQDSNNFSLSSSSSNIPPPPMYSKANDVLLIPYIHYGLNRNLTCFTLMDRDNILTHSPTLISFGGSSFELGYQMTLLMLDLDPPTKYSTSGELDTSFEFDWKLIKTENDQVFTNCSFTCIFGNIIYSKRNQAIYVFGRGWYKPYIAELSLKTLRWVKKDVSINHTYPSVKYAVAQDDENFLLCFDGLYPGNDTKLSIFKFSELEKVFASESTSEGLLNNEEPSNIFELYYDIQFRMTAPLANSNQTVIFGSRSNNGMPIIVDFNTKQIEKKCSYICNFQYPCATEIGGDSSTSKRVLFSSETMYYLFNVEKKASRSLTCSKSAIEMSNHKYNLKQEEVKIKCYILLIMTFY